MSAPLLAVIVAVVGLAATWWWFGINRRRVAESEAGVQALANMKWRECLGLVLEALQREGYREAHSSKQPGDGGSEFVLTRNDERVLLSYKHGTAYRLGEANVRDFANGVHMQGGTSGILLTLGSIEGLARDVAKKYGVQLIDGASLWPKVQRLVPAHILEVVRHEAATKTRKGLWIGAIASITAGVLVLLFGNGMFATDEPVSITTFTRTHAVKGSVIDPTLAQINATAKAMAAVAKLSDAERAERRAAVAKQVSSIVQVGSAVWSTQSTLLLSLKQTDGRDSGLIDEVCRSLTQYEELRFTRLQLEPPSDSDVPVRWRQCQ